MIRLQENEQAALQNTLAQITESLNSQLKADGLEGFGVHGIKFGPAHNFSGCPPGFSKQWVCKPDGTCDWVCVRI